MFSRRTRRRSGFTLVEVMIAMSLMAIMFLGAMTLYTESIRAATKSSAQISANQSSANGLQHVEDDLREAYDFALPEDSATFGSTLGSGYAPDDFQETYTDPLTSVARTIDTGIKLSYPNAASSTVYNSAGASINPARYDNSTAGTSLFIYRADMPANPATGTPATPDAELGDCLWASGSENGIAINQSLARLSDSRSALGGISASNTVPNAVEFLRNPAVTFLVETRLISSYYSPISSSNSTIVNQQSNQSNKTLLTGVSVLMRNHKVGS